MNSKIVIPKEFEDQLHQKIYERGWKEALSLVDNKADDIDKASVFVIRNLNRQINKLKAEKGEMLGEIHSELDNLNAERGSLCLYCDADVYDGKQGIIHEQDCIIIKLREELKPKKEKR